MSSLIYVTVRLVVGAVFLSVVVAGLHFGGRIIREMVGDNGAFQMPAYSYGLFALFLIVVSFHLGRAILDQGEHGVRDDG